MNQIEYEYERYLATPDNVNQVLDTYGVAIIPNILNDDECDAMNKGMWDTLEHLSQPWDKPIKRDQFDSWREMRQLYPKHSMLHQHWSIGHAQYIWDIRQNEKVVDIFAKIWHCKNEDLLVSFDGASYHYSTSSTIIK